MLWRPRRLLFSESSIRTITGADAPFGLKNPSSSTKLVFHTMGGQYFLSQIWTAGYDEGRQLPKSKGEVQMAKNHVKSDTFVLAAKLTR